MKHQRKMQVRVSTVRKVRRALDVPSRDFVTELSPGEPKPANTDAERRTGDEESNHSHRALLRSV